MNLGNIMKSLDQKGRFKSLTGLTLLCLLGQSPLGAAVWQGGDGNWTNGANWDLAGGYPGDGTHTSEFADMDNNGTGVVTIQAGDTINMGSTVFMGSTGVSISQTGGSMTIGTRIDNRTEYNLTGGTLTNNSSQAYVNGGVYNISGSGVWQRGSSTNAVSYQGAGEIHIFGGTSTMGRVFMDNGTTGNRLFKVTGTTATNVEIDSLSLHGPTTSAIATAEFVFDGIGIDPINVTATGGGAKLIIQDTGDPTLQGNLSADLTAYGATSGTEGFLLLDYFSPTRRNGVFGGVSVTGLNGSLTLGSDKDSLLANEYFLSYDDGTVGDGSSVVLYANVIPEPSSITLMVLAACGAALLSRTKKRGHN